MALAEATRARLIEPGPVPDEPVMLITGASTGIGAATARLAADAGYRLVLAARSEDRLRALADQLGGEDRVLARRCDVSLWEDQEALVAAALESFGRLDVAFANAGFGAKRGFLEESPEQWRSMVDTSSPTSASAAPATSSSPARSPAAAPCRAPSTRPRSGPSAAWARRFARRWRTRTSR